MAAFNVFAILNGAMPRYKTKTALKSASIMVLGVDFEPMLSILGSKRFKPVFTTS